MEKRVSDWEVGLLRGMGKRVSGWGVDPLRGMETQTSGLGVGHLRDKEKLAADWEGLLHSDRGKRAVVPRAAHRPDTVGRCLGGYSVQSTATLFQLQLGMGLVGIDSAGIGLEPACHVHGLHEVLALRPVHVCDVPSRDERPPFLRVYDVCPPRVAYRTILC